MGEEQLKHRIKAQTVLPPAETATAPWLPLVG